MNTEHFTPIRDLYDWSHNYDFPSPYSKFLDLIGYSEEELGRELCADKSPLLGYLELDYLADALKVVAKYGEPAYDYATDLLALEKEIRANA
jgi:hypothetical protein